MKNAKIEINGTPYDIVLATNDHEAMEGLSKAKGLLRPNFGMMFILSIGSYITTTDTKVPLDILFLSREMKVTGVTAYPQSFRNSRIQPPAGSSFAIEVRAGEVQAQRIRHGSGVKVSKELATYLGLEDSLVTKLANGGNFLSYNITDGEVSMDPNNLNILDKDGKVLMVVEDIERIFSIPDTKKALELAKNYRDTKDKKYLKKLTLHIKSSIINQEIRKQMFNTQLN